MIQKLITVLLFVVFFSLTLFSLALADNPPSLDNHQFYGEVYWNESLMVPSDVVAVAGGNSYLTPIRGALCEDDICVGSYGRDSDSILRLQGTAGQQVVFYLNDEQVASVPYEAGEADELDLFLGLTAGDISRSEPLPENVVNGGSRDNDGCDSDWNCTRFSSCANGTQSRFCVDENECNPRRLNRTEEKACGSGAVVPYAPCTYNWVCTLWSACYNEQQTRYCARQDVCTGLDVVDPGKPVEKKSCESLLGEVSPPSVEAKIRASCFDGILNQNEVETDCGGVCPACKRVETVPESSESNTLLIVGVIIMALVVIGLVVFLVIHKRRSAGISSEIEVQLDGIYNGAMEKGVSRAEVTQKLLDRGWDEKVITKYLTKK